MMGPDFVGIGAPRSGTSWLYEVLARHPGLWLPPVKELHYFDEPLQTKRYYSYLRMRLISGFWIRRPLSRFDLQYFLGRRSDVWYCNLFAPARRRSLLTGEITPAYSTLEEPALDETIGNLGDRVLALGPQSRHFFAAFKIDLLCACRRHRVCLRRRFHW
jgi:hypothetical protein